MISRKDQLDLLLPYFILTLTLLSCLPPCFKFYLLLAYKRID
ncbi:MAG: hypothetical protein KatS3mg049_1766 [Caldilinea sp.]|jgi:hypothetical protein|nr:MAG: hypothetical protein KatS3mg049_1766 [Caldilinea sp.]